MVRRGFPPSVFLIGAQKAGTTFLSNLLDQHPDITVANPKEPDFFTRNHHRGLGWYRNRFSGPDNNLLLDASTSYTAARLPEYDGDSLVPDSNVSAVPEKIHSLAPDARFIYVLRNPVDRIYSAYWHDVRQGNESRPFRQALAADSSYFRISNYAEQLKLYLTVFPKDAFLVLLFEDLIKNPVDAARRCYRFLGLDDAVTPELGRGQNKSFVYEGLAGRAMKAVLTIGGMNKLAKSVSARVPSAVKDWVGGLVTTSVPPMRDADRDFLREHFKGKNQEIENLAEISLAPWR